MASFNGAAWIAEQVASILAQQRVAVALFVSDDGSTDGTQALLASLAAQDARIRWSANPAPQGRAAANFFHLIRTVDVAGFDHVAYADQDDVWLPGKLALQAAQLAAHGADGVSSDVTAFWASGRQHLLRKSTPQRRYDFLFETPGPGCSMLITPRLFERLRALLADRGSAASQAGYHDWLTYAVARASGWRWHIGSEPTLLYRQHAANEVGMNRGPAAVLRRALRHVDGSYGRDCRRLLSVARECARLGGPPMPDLSAWDILRHGRRRGLHRFVMAAMFPLGLRTVTRAERRVRASKIDR